MARLQHTFASDRAAEGAFQANQFAQLVRFLCDDGYYRLILLNVMATAHYLIGYFQSPNQPIIDPMSVTYTRISLIRTISCTLLSIVVNKSLISQDLARSIVAQFFAVAPIIMGLWMLSVAGQCGETCDPKDWIPGLQLLCFMPMLTAMFLRLPFWQCVFWSRIACMAIATAIWKTVIPSDSGCLPAGYLYTQTLFITLGLGICAYEREKTERAAFHLERFRLQHTESTAILGTVSHDLRTPMHIVRSIISHLSVISKERAHALGDAQIQQLLCQAEHSCTRMEGITEDLLLTSTIHNTECRYLPPSQHKTTSTVLSGHTASPLIPPPLIRDAFVLYFTHLLLFRDLVMREDTLDIRRFIKAHVKDAKYRLKDGVTLDCVVGELVPSLVGTDETRLSQVSGVVVISGVMSVISASQLLRVDYCSVPEF
jgi:hypothetical protein